MKKTHYILGGEEKTFTLQAPHHLQAESVSWLSAARKYCGCDNLCQFSLQLWFHVTKARTSDAPKRHLRSRVQKIPKATRAHRDMVIIPKQRDSSRWLWAQQCGGVLRQHCLSMLKIICALELVGQTTSILFAPPSQNGQRGDKDTRTNVRSWGFFSSHHIDLRTEIVTLEQCALVLNYNHIANVSYGR